MDFLVWMMKIIERVKEMFQTKVLTSIIISHITDAEQKKWRVSDYQSPRYKRRRIYEGLSKSWKSFHILSFFFAFFRSWPAVTRLFSWLKLESDRYAVTRINENGIFICILLQHYWGVFADFDMALRWFSDKAVLKNLHSRRSYSFFRVSRLPRIMILKRRGEILHSQQQRHLGGFYHYRSSTDGRIHGLSFS